jgi:hypothetical protein
MLTQAVRSVRSISQSVKTNSFATQKTALLNGLALVVTCGIGAAFSNPAQAASFEGFGCHDNPSCQSYLRISNAGVSSGAGLWFQGNSSGPSEALYTPHTTTTATRFDSLGLGPANRLLTETIAADVIRDQIGTPYVTYGGKATADLWGVATLGTLKAAARAEVSANVSIVPDPSRDPNSYIPSFGAIAGAGANANLGWGDVITVTSNTHSLGEYVPFELSLYLDRLVSASGKYGGNSQASVSSDLSVGRFGFVGIGDSNFYPSDVFWQRSTVYLPVGELIPITGQLSIGAGALAYAVLPDQVLESDISIADASHTANYFLTPLVDGVSYTSASGKSYLYSGDATPVPTPALLPGLIGLGLGMWRKRKAEAES